MAGTHARLARRRAVELRRPCRRRAPVIGRLSGRCAVERGRSRKGLVRAGQVAPLVPPNSSGRAAGRAAVDNLRQPRLLSDPATLKAAMVTAARELGFDAIGVTRPNLAPETRTHL